LILIELRNLYLQKLGLDLRILTIRKLQELKQILNLTHLLGPWRIHDKILKGLNKQ